VTEIVGTSDEGTAVSGDSVRGKGVSGVSGQNAGVFGKGTPAGRFEGDLLVAGTVKADGVITAAGEMITESNIGAALDVNAYRDVNVGGTVNTQHVIAAGNISALGNVNSDQHIVAKGNIGAVGNLNANQHVVAHGNISAVGNVNAGETMNTKHLVAQGNISAIGNVNAHNMNVTGDILLANGDCAEEFDVGIGSAQSLAPGTVVVLDADGNIMESRLAYDKRVAGVVSGGGTRKPAIILGKGDSTPDRVAVSLMGTAFCKVDARMAPVEVGDLLTTSGTPGHAMKALDASQAFGAVIGKALRPLRQSRALIPILVALH
jgi:hypothetical protein